MLDKPACGSHIVPSVDVFCARAIN